MKKVIAIMMCLVVLTFAAAPAGAQTRRARRQQATRQSQQYDYDRYNDNSVWDKHRDKITTAGGAVGGALLGGLIGGKKGAVIGAIAGGGGAAVYTYKIRKKARQY